MRPPPIIILGHEWGPIFRWQRHFGLVEWRADYQVPQLRSFANWQSSCCSIGGRIEQLAHLFGAGAKERQLAEDLPPRVVLNDHGQLLLHFSDDLDVIRGRDVIVRLALEQLAHF